MNGGDNIKNQVSTSDLEKEKAEGMLHVLRLSEIKTAIGKEVENYATDEKKTLQNVYDIMKRFPELTKDTVDKFTTMIENEFNIYKTDMEKALSSDDYARIHLRCEEFVKKKETDRKEIEKALTQLQSTFDKIKGKIDDWYTEKKVLEDLDKKHHDNVVELVEKYKESCEKINQFAKETEEKKKETAAKNTTPMFG